MTTVRRAKWNPPPQPTPRRSRRRQHGAVTRPHVAVTGKPAVSIRHGAVTGTPAVSGRQVPNGKLASLVGQERELAYCGNNSISIPPVVLLNSGEKREVEDAGEVEMEVEEDRRGKRPDSGGDAITAEKWRFQAEILRAECKFLRMERGIAVKRLERERAFLETTLKSAVHTLISVKRRIRDGQSVDQVLEDEIEDLAKRLVEVQKCSRKKSTKKNKIGHFHASISNFDEQATLLQKQLEKLGGGNSSKKGQVREASTVMTLRRKMEGMSKGKLLKRMEEEYGGLLFLSTTVDRRRHVDVPSSSAAALLQDSSQLLLTNPRLCSENCRAIVRRIMEQVRAETEQWSQMQEMLAQVREEMEELQTSRDFWEDRALDAEYNIESLQSSVQQWKEKTHSLQIKDTQQLKQLNSLQKQLDSLNVQKDLDIKRSKEPPPESLEAQLRKEKERWALTYNRMKANNTTSKESNRRSVYPSSPNNTTSKENNRRSVYPSSPNNTTSKENNRRSSSPNNTTSKEKEKEKERRGLTDNRMKGNNTTINKEKQPSSPNRFPFRDIGNLSSPAPLLRQNSRRSVYPLQTPHHTAIR